MRDGSSSRCPPQAGRGIVRDRALLETVKALLRAVDCHDQCTGDHAERVTDYTLQLAAALGLTAADCLTLEVGALLHDVGKIAVDDAILRKPSALTAAEFAAVRTHPVQGWLLLQAMPALAPILPIVRHHHERWDGGGYPDGLAGDAIPRLAQVVAVADAFDAMTSDRPYRPALAPQIALARIEAGAGTQFAPPLVAAFVRLRPQVAGRRQLAFPAARGFARAVLSGVATSR